jgi:predicted dehydrogenase
MEVVNWGIIGGGDVCERKGGPPLYKLPGCRLVGVHRRHAAKGKLFAQRHGPCRYFETYEELLATPEINAIYVATPPECHLAHTLAAAAAGKHVLCEKPMAMTAAECRTMVDACKAAGVTLAVAYYRRCYPSVEEARFFLETEAIGRVRSMFLNDQFPASHRLDLVHFLCGELATVSVREEPLPPGSHAEHGPVLRARTRSGVEVTMGLGWREHGVPEFIEFQGDAGRVTIEDLKEGRVTLVSNGKTLEHFPDPLPYTHWGLVKNFVAHLREGVPLACDGEEGRKSSVILDYASVAPADGSEVDVDYDRTPDMNLARAAGMRLLG